MVRGSGVSNLDETKGLSTRMDETIRLEMTTISVFDVDVLRIYLHNDIVMKFVEGGITKYMEAMAAAAFALAFAGRDIHLNDIDKLLQAAAIKSDERLKLFIGLTHVLHYRNHRDYIYAIFFIKFVGREPTVEGLVDIARAMGVETDANIAKRTLDFYNECMQGKHPIVEEDESKGVVLGRAFKKFRKVVMDFADTMADFYVKEMDSILVKRKDILELSPAIDPYIWAVGTLAFAGKDIERDTVEAVVQAVGITPEDNLLDAIVSLRFRNRLTYIIAVNYLIAIEVEPTVQKVLDTVRAIDVIPDALVAKQAIEYFKARDAEQK